ncbi:DNA (cytosine-5-)-methyltransferase [Sediminitomix flava]|uniref:Cytosine-specific methyltransferase n=1 Tax=Sediminitomix flava TaxID=379075 RepID=A0A315ZC38_SEDFL|nr:DNA (cytosine-5-)-methyltransferase [Sediminitomix flava]PWJ42663.1 DNA (cytosine-5)-methyltransferase 1 [Sediminitomix flava]
MFKFIDLFAGIGGFHLGMHSIDGHCVFASEIDKFARQTYEYNYKRYSPEVFEEREGEFKLFNEDITTVTEKEDLDKIPEFDVLCAGFPCQPFSHAGLKKGFGDTRGTLFFNIEQIVKNKIENGTPPKVLFLENVKGLKGHDKGHTFKTIVEHLHALGYHVQAEVLNSKHFGVPQNRERIFIIAWYKDAIPVQEGEFKFPWGIDQDGEPFYEYSKRDNVAVSTRVGDVLFTDKEIRLEEKRRKEESARAAIYTISDKLWEGHKNRIKKHKANGNGFGYSLFKDDSPYTSTISARYYKDGSEALIYQEDRNPRKLHPIEAAKLQGYPVEEDPTKGLRPKGDAPNDDKFYIPVSDTQAYKQFGNSVSVPVIKALAKEIKEQLLDKSK